MLLPNRSSDEQGIPLGGQTPTYAPAAGGGQINYLYGGDGQRVQKAITGGTTENYVHDIFGKLIAKYSSNSTAATSPCVTCYISTDHLGSTRLVTGDNAAIIARHDYLPFGEEILTGQAGRNSQWGVTAATQNLSAKTEKIASRQPLVPKF